MIKENVQNILNELPSGVELEAAAKGRTPQEIQEAVDAGVKIVGENYVQEAQKAFTLIKNRVKWHFIGHLQKNKIKKAIRIFDMIETIDSFELAEQVDKQCADENKMMPILIEINSAEEKQKSGVLPQQAQALIKEISNLINIKIMGIMTMGPAPYPSEASGSGPTYVEDIKQCFRQTKKLFEEIKALNLPNVEMKYLSMGMSGSYKIAILEGANLIRIGTKIFEKRAP